MQLSGKDEIQIHVFLTLLSKLLEHYALLWFMKIIKGRNAWANSRNNEEIIIIHNVNKIFQNISVSPTMRNTFRIMTQLLACLCMSNKKISSKKLFTLTMCGTLEYFLFGIILFILKMLVKTH